MPVALPNRVQLGHVEAVEKLTARVYWRRVGDSGYTDAGNVRDYSDGSSRSTVRRARSEGGMRNVDNEQSDRNHEAYLFTLDERTADHEPLIRLAKGLSDTSQSAVEGATAIIEDIGLGLWYDVGAYNLANVRVSSDTAGTLVEDSDYKLNRENGRIQLLADGQAQEGDDILLTFDQPALGFERAQSQQSGAFLCDLIFEESNQFSKVPLRRTEGRFFLNIVGFQQQSGEFATYRLKATPGDPTVKVKRTVAEAIPTVPDSVRPANSSSSSSLSSSSSYSSSSSPTSVSSASSQSSASSPSSSSQSSASSSSTAASETSSSSSTSASSHSSSSTAGSLTSQSSVSSSSEGLSSEGVTSQTSDDLTSDGLTSDEFSSEGLGNGLLPGLQFFMELDEASGPAFDSSGNGLTFFENETVPVSGGNRGNARTFDPSEKEKYLYLASRPALEFSSGRFSMAAWVKLENINHDGVIMAKARGDIAGGLSWLWEYDFGSGNIQFYHSANGDSWDDVVQVTPLGGVTGAEWYLCWVVQEDSLLRLGVWRKGDESFAEEIVPAVGFHVTSVNVTLGNWVAEVGGAGSEVNCLHGSLDDVGLWVGVAHSECQITKLFNGGDGVDPTDFDSLTCG